MISVEVYIVVLTIMQQNEKNIDYTGLQAEYFFLIIFKFEKKID